MITCAALTESSTYSDRAGSSFLNRYSFHGSAWIYVLLIVYLLINTGLVSDDFAILNSVKGNGIFGAYGIFFHLQPLSHLFFGLPYYFIGGNYVFYDLLKIVYLSVSFFMVSSFFSIYHRGQRRYLLSFAFLFFPNHDSTAFGFMFSCTTLSAAFYLYAFYLASEKKMVSGFFTALAASFIYYGSLPFAIMLSLLFLMERRVKEALCMYIPNLIYIAYYFFITVTLGKGVQKIRATMDIIVLMKLFVLQFLTFIDANIGVSFWLKVYCSLSEISFLSIIIGIVLTVFLVRPKLNEEEGYNTKLIISFVFGILASFVVYSFSGYYPQLAFNLGNRTALYGSLLLAYIAITLPARITTRVMITGLLLFSVLGISDHWKNWNKHQTEVIMNIRENKQLLTYRDNRVIFVSGNQYSNLNGISHLEFFSESYVVKSVFSLALKNDVVVATLNRRYKYTEGQLLDTKYNNKFPVNSFINVYDSERNILLKVRAEDIGSYLASLKPDRRHWTQFLEGSSIRDLLLMLMPRLRYAY